MIDLFLESLIFFVLWLGKLGFEFLKDYGPTIIIRAMIGRHLTHHPKQRNTNATFWRDSDGKPRGTVSGTILKRHHRAGYKNLMRSLGYLLVTVGLIYGLYNERIVTIVIASSSFMAFLVWRSINTYKNAKNWYQTRAMVKPLAAAMSSIPGIEDSDMERSITLRPDYFKVKRGVIGQIAFPDSFHANDTEKLAVARLVESRFPIPVELKWQTLAGKKEKKFPVVYAQILAAPPIPKMIRFTDHIPEIRKLKAGEYIIGYDRFSEPLVLSHNGDRPHKAFSMNSGTGKTTLLGSVAAQLLGNDPESSLTGFDVKRVSLEFLKGIAGVTIYSDPGNLREMWNGWYALKKEMDTRYALKQSGQQTSFPRHWIFLEEGNTFATMMNAFYKNEIREGNSKQTSPLWYEVIGPLLWQGREVNMFMEAVLQNFMEKYFGNLSLRPSFGTIGMAGYKPNQWNAIIQTRPIPECQEGQGRIMIVDGPRQVWVQGLYGTHSELREYATKSRSKKQAA